jgi:hypothetical protein
MQGATIKNDKKVSDGISVQKVLWVINDVSLYRGFTVINFNRFSGFDLLIYLAQ